MRSFSVCNRRTQAALDMWQEMGSHASTPSTVLPITKKAKADEEGQQEEQEEQQPDQQQQQQQQQQQRSSIDREAPVPAEVEA